MKKSLSDVDNTENTRTGKVIYFFTMIIIVISATLSPWVIHSMYKEMTSNSSNADAFNLVHSDSPDKIDIALTYDGNPIKGIAQITVSGYKSCTSPAQCTALGTTLLISSFFLDQKKTDEIPAYVTLPLAEHNGTYEAKLTLPISGNIATYPYDTWTSNISIVLPTKITNLSKILTRCY